MDNNLDQREAIHATGQWGQHPQQPAQGVSKSYRMMQAAINLAAHGRYVLVLCDNRNEVIELSGWVPLEVSKYLTVRCIESHPDIDWVQWTVPGWENHELFVDHWLLKKRFPKLISMLNY